MKTKLLLGCVVAAMSLCTSFSAQATKYFFKADVVNSGDGLSWESAIAGTDLRGVLDAKLFTDGDELYFAGGTYIQDGGMDVFMENTGTITFKGGYPTDLTGTATPELTYPTATPTIFSGDANKDGIGNKGDCGNIIIAGSDKGNFNFFFNVEGITFANAYNIGSADWTSGALYARNGAKVSVKHCSFENNNAPLAKGGGALTVYGALIECVDCSFTGNHAIKGGSAVHVADNGGMGAPARAVFNRCLFTKNSTDTVNISGTTGAYGTIFAESGYTWIVNSTVSDNVAYSDGAAIATANNAGRLYVVSSTIANNRCKRLILKGDNGYGHCIRTYTNDSVYMANSIIIDSIDTADKVHCAIYSNNGTAASTKFISGGGNIVGGVYFSSSKATDDMAEKVWRANDKYGTENVIAKYFSTPLNEQGVLVPTTFNAGATVETLKALMDGQTGPWKADFMENLTPIDVTVDQRGNLRSVDNTETGAYDRNYITPAEHKYFFKADVTTSGDGKTWETAFAGSDLRDALKADLFAEGDTLFLAGGTYIQVGGMDLDKALVIKGGYPSNLTFQDTPELSYPTENPTIFSGDANKDGIMNEGDCGNILIAGSAYGNFNINMTIEGVTFTKAYNGSTNDMTSGAIFARNGVRLHLKHCTFDDNKTLAPGAAALTVFGGLVDVKDCIFTGNSAFKYGGAVRVADNGGMGAPARAVFERCLFANNSLDTESTEAEAGTRGAVLYLQSGKAWIVNSTVTGNKAQGDGGAFFVDNRKDYELYIMSSTVADNSCTNATAANGTAIRTLGAGRVFLTNSIVTGATDAKDIANAPVFVDNATASASIISNGNNVIGSVYCSTEGADDLAANTWKANDNCDKTENTSAAVFGTNVLADNGGFTKTILTAKPIYGATVADFEELLKINTAEAQWQPEYTVDMTVDQRINNRSDVTEVGAVDRNIAQPTPHWFFKADVTASGDGKTWETAMAGSDLRAALNAKIFADGDILYFAGGTYIQDGGMDVFMENTGTITFKGGYPTDLTGTATPKLTYPTATPTIFSGDANKDGIGNVGDCGNIIIAGSGNGNFNFFFNVEGITFANAYNSGNGDHTSGALYVRNGAKATIKNCTFENNKAPLAKGGAALTVFGGLLNAIDCKFTGNSALRYGGAICVADNGGMGAPGRAVFERCLINNNSTDTVATSGTTGTRGGAFYLESGYAWILNSTLTGNTAYCNGAAIGLANKAGARLYVVSSTITDNHCTRVTLDEAKPNSYGATIYQLSSAKLYLANNLLVEREDDGTIKYSPIYANSTALASNIFVSGGNNILGSTSFVTPSLDDLDANVWKTSDTSSSTNLYATYFGDNTLTEEGVIVPLSYNTGATVDGLKDLMTSDDWKADFMDGLVIDMSVDQRGESRGTTYTEVGAMNRISTAVTTVTDGKNAGIASLGNDSYQVAEAENGLKVYDTMGHEVLTSDNNTVSLQGLTNGLYVISTGAKAYKVIK